MDKHVIGKFAVVRKESMGASSQAHPALVVVKDTEQEALHYIEEHHGLLPRGEYLSLMSLENFMRTV